MAVSDESMTLRSCISSMQEEEEDDVDMRLGTYLSRLSVENFDGDVEDASFSDHTKQATCLAMKECVSESEVHSKDSKRKRRWRKRRRTSRVMYNNKEKEKEKEMESDSESVSSEMVVITRPKGGKRSLCMDMEEVKACRELGFELEHQQMLEMPHCNRLSLSVSDTATVSSGADSPTIAANSSNWRISSPISSPGDDPRDVKARLKVWAQAVALASSASRPPTSN